MPDEASLSKDKYALSVAAESRKWGDHLKVEARGEMHAWLDHPSILRHYESRGLIEGLAWDRWVMKCLQGSAERSLELGCGSGSRSLGLWSAGVTRCVEGVDVSAERVAEAEKRRSALGIPGGFRVEDMNAVTLKTNTYDLIFSAHSFHHFLELEHIMEQVHEALTPGGVFILEEFVGPTQFQWSEEQIGITKGLLGVIPERYRHFRWGDVKTMEGRPTVAEVVAASPFESIRSAEILPLFEKSFRILRLRNYGGTVQHLLYNGIVHNFIPGDQEAERYVQSIYEVEDVLVDSGTLPSDFRLLVGARRERFASVGVLDESETEPKR